MKKEEQKKIIDDFDDAVRDLMKTIFAVMDKHNTLCDMHESLKSHVEELKRHPLKWINGKYVDKVSGECKTEECPDNLDMTVDCGECDKFTV